jgi:hypothetical protein
MMLISLVRMSASPETAGATIIPSCGKAEDRIALRLHLFAVHVMFIAQSDRGAFLIHE